MYSSVDQLVDCMRSPLGKHYRELLPHLGSFGSHAAGELPVSKPLHVIAEAHDELIQDRCLERVTVNGKYEQRHRSPLIT